MISGILKVLASTHFDYHLTGIFTNVYLSLHELESGEMLSVLNVARNARNTVSHDNPVIHAMGNQGTFTWRISLPKLRVKRKVTRTVRMLHGENV